MIQWIKGGLSYSDGTMDTELMLAIGTVATFLGATWISVRSGHEFHPELFGQGAGFLFAGLAAVLKFRKVD
jgi:hypothetical protein